jgi:1,2-diacylglycerol 3-alpha-glucosyltransferase
MRALICATEYYPDGSGIANVAYNVVQELESMGVECTVCSPTGPDIKLGNSTHIKKYGILGMLEYWYQVSRYFKANDYDFAWLHNPFILTGNPFRRCLVTMHSTYYGASTYWHSLGKRLYISLVAYIERYCLIRMPPNTSFTGVGQTVCDELEKIGIARDRMVYIPNGVNIGQFCPLEDKKPVRKKFGIPEEDIVLLSVGRLTHQKQPHTMIEVFSRLEKELGDVTLCIAGKGELLEETKEFAEKMGLRKVLFLGYVDDRDLPDLYACADYYIMTSKYEGGMPPLTLAEAMASGLPCIVSNIPNLGMIVEDADCGIIINHDVNIASEQILDYIVNDNSNHSQNARKYALDKLDWHRISEQYLEELLNLM